MRTILSRPSRSYKDVEHDAQGLSAVGTAPYALRQRDAPDQDKYSVKTYRPCELDGRDGLTPAMAEMHFKKQAMHDPNPTSSFSPLPPAFNIGRKSKEQARAGHRAEVNHMLEPEFQSSRQREDDAASMAGPSRLSSVRTAGGLAAAALSRKKGRGADESRPSESGSSYQQPQQGGARRANPGVYVDSSGRTHDTEYDPFAGVAAVSRRKSKQRRSAFGQRRNSASSSSSDASSDGPGPTRATALNTDGQETEKECRRRLEAERRQLDDVSGYAAARRQSLMSDRASGFYSGRGTPSLRSGRDDTMSLAHTLAPNGRAPSRLNHGYQPSPVSPTFDRSSAVSGSSHNARSYPPSYPAGSSAGNDESPRKHTEKTEPSEAAKVVVAQKEKTRKAEAPDKLRDEKARARRQRPEPLDEESETESEHEYEDAGEAPPRYEAPEREVGEGVGEGVGEEVGAGLGAQLEALPEHAPEHHPEHHPEYSPQHPPEHLPEHQPQLPRKTPLPELNPMVRVKSPPAEPNHSISVLPKPGAAKTKNPKSRVERSASGATRVTGFDAGPTRPMPSPQSQTQSLHVPAATRLRAESVASGLSSHSSERETDAPRRHRRPKERPREQIFPETPAQAKRREERERRNLRAGKTPAGTYAADSALPGTSSATRILPEIKFVDDDDPRIVFPPDGPSTRVQHPRSINTIQSDLRNGSMDYTGSMHRGSSHSARVGSSKEPSAIIEESGGGYLPSRWASGDRQLRVDATTKEMYRPKEWGGRKGDLGGRPDEWRPTVKDEMKRELKDLTTNARFSLFRAKKKIGRRTDL